MNGDRRREQNREHGEFQKSKRIRVSKAQVPRDQPPNQLCFGSTDDGVTASSVSGHFFSILVFTVYVTKWSQPVLYPQSTSTHQCYLAP